MENQTKRGTCSQGFGGVSTRLLPLKTRETKIDLKRRNGRYGARSSCMPAVPQAEPLPEIFATICCPMDAINKSMHPTCGLPCFQRGFSGRGGSLRWTSTDGVHDRGGRDSWWVNAVVECSPRQRASVIRAPKHSPRGWWMAT